MPGAVRADQYAPPHLKSVWLAIFLMAIPVGYAVGYIYGAVMGTLLGWRGAFMSAALLMLPFTCFAFVTKPVPLSKNALNGHAPAAATGSRNHAEHGHVDTVADPAAVAAAAAAYGDEGDAVVVSALDAADKLALLEVGMEPSDGAGHMHAMRRKPELWEGNGADHPDADGVAPGGGLGCDVPSAQHSMQRQTVWLLRCDSRDSRPLGDAGSERYTADLMHAAPSHAAMVDPTGSRNHAEHGHVDTVADPAAELDARCCAVL